MIPVELGWYLLGAVLGSVQGSLCYAAVRFLEKHSPWLVTTIFWIVGGSLLLFTLSMVSVASVAGWVIVGFSAFFCAWFHQRAVDEPVSDFRSYLIGLESMALTVALLFLGYPLLLQCFSGPASRAIQGWYGATGFLFPALAPLGWWLWRSSQVRPGIDEPVETEAQP